MVKPDDKEDDQMRLEKVGRGDVSDDSDNNKGFISILWSDDRLPTFKGRPLDHFGHKETLQAGDTIRYIKSMGVAGRKDDVETTKIISVHPKRKNTL
eukprot:11332049-Ditylum_brightwellii.AAC.2